jgi:hypothetical protein
MMAPSKDVCAFYFSPIIPNDTAKTGKCWTCNKCGKSKLKSGGWTNLLNHARSCVGSTFESDYESLHADQLQRGRITAFVHRVNDAERDMYKWIEWVVMKNQPLSMVDCPLTREGMQYKAVTSKSLRKNMLALCQEMKESVKSKLPDKFALVFDGWTEGTEHFIGITASYVSKGVDQVVTHTLLSMRPLLADDIVGMTASDHLHHLSKVLRQYGKTEVNIVCLVGDNCSVNKCMSRLLKVPLLGCGSHKLNLAVRKWISNQPQLEETISKVATVMKKASTLKVSAQLRKLTSLQTVRENDTRWSSTFEMIARFFRIQFELSAVSDLIPLIPTLVECDLLTKGFEHLKHFHEITVMLQKEGITFLRVREIFDEILEDYPELGSYLAVDAEIVVDVTFERALMQIAKGMVLTNEQLLRVKGLLAPTDATYMADCDNISNVGTVVRQEDELSYAQKVDARIKRRKTNEDAIATKYVNLSILCGTSVVCERLFSVAKNILSDTRKKTSPPVFEAIILLKMNRSEWDVYMMGKAMGRLNGASANAADNTAAIAGAVDVDDDDLFYT